MSDFRSFGRTGVEVSSERSWVGAWAGRDGALRVEPSIQAYINAGQGYGVTIGAFSTPITGGGAGTVLDIDQPEGVISVPSGVAIKLFSVKVQCQVPLLATDADECEILLAVDSDTAWAGDGTFTEETPKNLRTNSPNTSGISVASAFTADTTDPVLDMELDRAVITGDVQGTAATALWTPLSLDYRPDFMPLLVGPCSVWLYWGGTVATPGFAQLQFVKVDPALGSTG